MRGRWALLKCVRGGGEIKAEDDGSVNAEGTGRAELVVVLPSSFPESFPEEEPLPDPHWVHFHRTQDLLFSKAIPSSHYPQV